MTVGLVGAGNMARALARGWDKPILCTDGGSGRAVELAGEVGGEALESNAELARRSEIIILAHKPAQLDVVAAEVQAARKLVVSLLARTPLKALQEAFPLAEVIRVQPNTPVEVRRGVTLMAEESSNARVRELFEAVGEVVEVAERLLDAAAACSGVGPAYMSLVAEAQIDAAVKHGVPAALAGRLIAENMAGTAELLKERGYDTLAVRREVASPGGTTARGLAALERAGLRAAFGKAMDDVVDPR